MKSKSIQYICFGIADESIYWLELLQETDYIKLDEFESLNADAVEIMKLITSIIVSSKKSAK